MVTVVVKMSYYHVCGGKDLTLTEDDLSKGLMPLVWFNKGLWGIIPVEIIANAFTNLEDRKRLPKLVKKPLIGKFYWDQCVPIPAKAAKALLDWKEIT